MVCWPKKLSDGIQPKIKITEIASGDVQRLWYFKDKMPGLHPSTVGSDFESVVARGFPNTDYTPEDATTKLCV